MKPIKFSTGLFLGGLGIIMTWLVVALLTWLWLEPQAQLVNARPPSLPTSVQALDALARPVVAVDLAALERVKLWGLERNGQPPVAAAASEIKTVTWSVTARVVRPAERYLVLYQAESKTIQQVREGELMPDGSKLIKLGLDSFTVRLPNGKTRTMELNS